MLTNRLITGNRWVGFPAISSGVNSIPCKFLGTRIIGNICQYECLRGLDRSWFLGWCIRKHQDLEIAALLRTSTSGRQMQKCSRRGRDFCRRISATALKPFHRLILTPTSKGVVIGSISTDILHLDVCYDACFH